MTGIPARLTAGDTWQWSDADAWGSAPGGWDIRASFISGGRTCLSVPGISDPSARTVRFTAAARDTAAMRPGNCAWAVAAVDPSGQRITLSRGRVEIDPDPEGAGDSRTRAERILSAIEATIEGRATKDADSYTIEGRSIARTPIADLLRLRAIYKAEVAAQRHPGASPISYRRIKI